MTKNNIRSLLYLGVFGLVLFVFASGSFSLEPPMHKSKTTTVKIMKLEGSSFTVKERKFSVDDNTDIRDRFNRKIKLHLMWVPCKAEVEYVVSKGMEYRCLKIKVLEELGKDTVNAEVRGDVPK